MPSFAAMASAVLRQRRDCRGCRGLHRIGDRGDGSEAAVDGGVERRAAPLAQTHCDDLATARPFIGLTAY